MSIFGKLLTAYEKHREMKKWKKVITSNFKDLENHKKLTKDQKKEIQDFYVGIIGKKIPLTAINISIHEQEYLIKNMYLPTMKTSLHV